MMEYWEVYNDRVVGKEEPKQNFARELLQRSLKNKNRIVDEASKSFAYHYEKFTEQKKIIDTASVEAQQLEAALAKNGWSVA